MHLRHLNRSRLRFVRRRLDKGKKGYLDMFDWGQVETFETVETFTLMYMRRCLGLPDVMSTKDQVDRYLRSQGLRKVKSLPAAIKLVTSNGLTRGSWRQTNIVHDSFRWVGGWVGECVWICMRIRLDRDQSGDPED